MIRTLTITFAVLSALITASLLQGCGSPTAKAAGTYTLDKAAIKAELQKKIESIEDPSEKYEATVRLGGIDDFPTMSFVLAEDGTLEAKTVMMGMTDTTKGSWSISGSTVTFRMTDTGANDPDEMTGTLRGDSIELNSPNGEEMPFRMIFTRTKA